MMRLHHLLYERLQTARGICEQARDAKGASVAHPLKVGWDRIGGLLVAVVVVGCCGVYGGWGDGSLACACSLDPYPSQLFINPSFHPPITG